MAEPVRILLVEDNLVMQYYIKAAISEQPDFAIAAIAADGLEAVEQAVSLRPDVILLDLYLPSIDGIEVIYRVMQQAPCPIVVISSELDRAGRDLSFEAQKAGAVDILAKPKGMQEADYRTFADQLSAIIRALAGSAVARLPSSVDLAPTAYALKVQFDLLLIGASTGGPAALYRLLETIGPDFDYSVVIAQHMAEGFTDSLCQWLAKTGCRVKLAAHGEPLQRATVYLAPDNRHVLIGKQQRLWLKHSPMTFTPNVDELFFSAADNYSGRICALLLTGMGSDGAEGLLKLQGSGAFTVAESEQSCVVFGMPKAAIACGAAKSILSLDEICAMLAA